MTGHCIRECTPCQEDMADLSNEIVEKDAIIAALAGALAYYAEIRNYSRAGGDPPDAEPFILSDRGARARAALAGEGQG